MLQEFQDGSGEGKPDCNVSPSSSQGWSDFLEQPVHYCTRNSERAICKTPQCKLDHMLLHTPGTFQSTHRLRGPGLRWVPGEHVPVSISLDGGAFVNTGLNFTYKHPQMTTPTSAVGSASNVKPLYYLIVALLLIGVFKLRLFAGSARSETIIMQSAPSKNKFV